MNWKYQTFSVLFSKAIHYPGHFVLSEYWPQGVYPLRKDVKANEVKLNPAPPEEDKTAGRLGDL